MQYEKEANLKQNKYIAVLEKQARNDVSKLWNGVQFGYMSVAAMPRESRVFPICKT